MRDKSKVLIIIFIIIILAFLICILVKNIYSVFDVKIEKKQIIYYENSNPIDIKKIVDENTKINKSEKIVVQEIDLEYKTLYKENKDLPNGYFRVLQVGENGKQAVVMKQIYQDNSLVGEVIVANNVVENSIEKIIEIGTGNGYLKKDIRVGDKVYVSANNLKLKKENDLQSKNIELLEMYDTVEILEIQDNWYYVKKDNCNGFVLKEGISTYNPNVKMEFDSEENITYSKNELLEKINFGMDLSIQSGLSLEQFEQIFENQERDRNNILKENAKYFYYAEEQYNINGVFLAAIAIHESAWGTSAIARNKNNLFGYAAYDRDPYNSASNFTNCAEGIDLVARMLMKNYLNSAGTQLADGSIATGKYYNGKTVSDVNKRYATDKNWANCVYRWMETLYNSVP
ncbi:MAG: glucosaminidase domain-containing protein [Clostridia bacterium]|nr:glucosaminidase domain-containing protein [Clostridia bacterium]